MSSHSALPAKESGNSSMRIRTGFHVALAKKAAKDLEHRRRMHRAFFAKGTHLG
jgi:hypothetical protein